MGAICNGTKYSPLTKFLENSSPPYKLSRQLGSDNGREVWGRKSIQKKIASSLSPKHKIIIFKIIYKIKFTKKNSSLYLYKQNSVVAGTCSIYLCIISSYPLSQEQLKQICNWATNKISRRPQYLLRYKNISHSKSKI